MLIAHQSPTALFDKTDIYQNIFRDYKVLTGPQDSSIWKVIENGMKPEEIFIKSVNLTYYPAEKLMYDIRGVNEKFESINE